MMNLTEIQGALMDRKINVVAERTALTPATIYRVLKSQNVSYETIRRLSDYFESKPLIKR